MPDEGTAASVEVDPATTDKTKKIKPGKPLPTYRIALQKQLDILRAYAIVHETTGKVVTNAEVANIVKMAATTVPHANSFFGDPEIGLLQKNDGGYIPSAAVISFHRAYAWTPDTAAHKLAPAFQTLWFAQALMPRLGFRAMDEREAIGVLAEACGATPDFETQLGLVLALMEAAGMIEREGGQVRATRPAGLQPIGTVSTMPPDTSPPTRGVETTFARPSDSDGVHLNVSINVDMKEMGTWAPDRITAFFAGFAQVLAAKGALEKNAAKE